MQDTLWLSSTNDGSILKKNRRVFKFLHSHHLKSRGYYLSDLQTILNFLPVSKMDNLIATRQLL